MKKGQALLRVLRAAQEPKVTQSQLARKVGISPARYWQIENGEGAKPSEGERAAIAAALSTSVSAIAWPVFAAREALAS